MRNEFCLCVDFCGLNYQFFFQNQHVSFVRKANSIIKQRDGLLVLKVGDLFQIISGINKLPTCPNFLNWVSYIKKSVSHKLFLKFEELYSYLFFSKFDVSSKNKSVLFSWFVVFIESFLPVLATFVFFQKKLLKKLELFRIRVFVGSFLSALFRFFGKQIFISGQVHGFELRIFRILV